MILWFVFGLSWGRCLFRGFNSFLVQRIHFAAGLEFVCHGDGRGTFLLWYGGMYEGFLGYEALDARSVLDMDKSMRHAYVRYGNIRRLRPSLLAVYGLVAPVETWEFI